MATERQDLSLDQLERAVRAGDLLLVVGPQFSGREGVPFWRNLEQSVVQARNKLAHGRDADLFEHLSPTALAALAYKAANDADPAVPAVYRAVCQLPLRTIITTNYDLLLERALQETGKRASAVFTPWDLEHAWTHGAETAVVKLRGDVSSPQCLAASLRQGFWNEFSQRLFLKAVRRTGGSCCLFIGFDAHDVELHRLAESYREIRPNDVVFVVLDAGTSRELPMHIRNTVSTMKSGPARPMFDVLAARCRSAASLDTRAEMRPAQRNILAEYARGLAVKLWSGWTIDPSRRVDPLRIHFRAAFRSRPLTVLPWSAERMSLLGLTQSSDAEAAHSFTIIESWAGVLERVWTRRHLSVVGEAGAGKTTFLRSLTIQLARQPSLRYFPVFCSARDLFAVDGISAESIWRVVEETSGVPLLAEALHTIAEHGRLLLIVDGLDELDSARMTQLVHVLNALTEKNDRCRVVTSSRPFGNWEFLRSNTEDIAWLLPFDDEQIQHFVSCWFTEGSTAEAFVRAIRENAALSKFARNPLYLSMMAHLWQSRGTSEVSAYRVYEAVVELLLGDWDHHRGIFRPQEFATSLKWSLLGILGRLSVQTSRQSLRFLDILSAVQQESVFANMSAAEVARLLHEIEECSNLITRSAEDKWQFAHISFVEFFAAKWLRDVPATSIVDEIRASRLPGAWMRSLSLALSDMAEKDAVAKLAKVVRDIAPDMVGSVEQQAKEDRDVFRGRAD